MVSQKRLRAMCDDDVDQVLAWRNHPDVRRYMYTQHEIKKSEHIAWYERTKQQKHKHLLIYEKDLLPVGFVNITVVNESARRADWGFYLAPDAVKGAGQELGRSAIEYAFKEVNIHKLCGEALAFNERSIAFHLRLGFHQEGCLRDHHFDGVSYHDVMAFGLLADEWTNL